MKRVLLTFAGIVAFVIVGVGSSRAADWPANVRAIYDVNFNGFNVGAFEFQSQSEEESYTLTGNAQLSLLLGAFTWIGETRAFGLIANHMPQPAAFAFDFKANSKAGSTKMDFADGIVANVKHSPPPVPKPGTVPLRQQHLKGVLDPLSAIMVVARGSNPEPLRPPPADLRRQGTLRSRLELQGADQGERAAAERPTCHRPCLPGEIPADRRAQGRHGKLFHGDHRCHRSGLASGPQRQRPDPLPDTIPTLVGYATLVSKRVEIETPGKPQIALLH